MSIPGLVDPVPATRDITPRSDGRIDLIGLPRPRIRELFEEAGLDAKAAKLRAKQVFHWLYHRGVTDFEAMTDIAKSMRPWLATRFVIGRPDVVEAQHSVDGTRKWLLRTADGHDFEMVFIPDETRGTLCVSSQVGCAYDCKFCASGLAGFTRNLTAAEIVEQIVQVEAHSGERVDNLVFMGMGEPLANFSNVTKAVEILNAEWGIGIGARHMTISTSGLAPQIEKLADFPLQIRLAISLHGATDPVRDQIMPVNRKYPLAELFAALEQWNSKRKQFLTFEFILIEDINDSLEQAKALASRARRVNAKVNLIPYNTVDGLPWKRPSEARQDAFLKVLTDAGVTATLRREKGHDIAAACGQLRLKQETQLGIIESPIPAKRITIGGGA
jgi:23S rRNA (adenine2503-C2)-methyltransferase